MLNVNKKEKETRLAYLLVGLAAGFIAGYFTHKLIEEKTTLSAEKVLEGIKEQFLEDGDIEGTWIELKRQPYSNYSTSTEVYRGGLSRYEGPQLAHYEFLADAYSGTPVEIRRL